MKITRKIFSILYLALFIIFISNISAAKEKPLIENSAMDVAAGTSSGCPPSGCPLPKEEKPGGKDKYEYEYEKTASDLSYKRMYYSFGACGSYFARRSDLNIKSVIGVLTDIEYRISKYFSFGFDSYYGWLSGGGNQYLSIFNPGIKIFPMAYKNPTFEPYFFLGGHALEGVFGDSTDYGKMGMGQGGFAGFGLRYVPESIGMGLQFFARASFLSMQKPKSIGGRAFVIPVLGFAGVTY